MGEERGDRGEGTTTAKRRNKIGIQTRAANSDQQDEDFDAQMQVETTKLTEGSIESRVASRVSMKCSAPEQQVK